MNPDVGNKMLMLLGHSISVKSVCMSVDGTRVVTGSWDKTAIIWNAETGERLVTLSGHTDWVSSVCMSVDGTRVVTGSRDNTAIIWTTDIEADCGLSTAVQNTILQQRFPPNLENVFVDVHDLARWKIRDTLLGLTLNRSVYSYILSMFLLHLIYILLTGRILS